MDISIDIYSIDMLERYRFPKNKWKEYSKKIQMWRSLNENELKGDLKHKPFY